MSEPVVHLADVAVRYGATAVWQHLDLDIDAGQFVAVLGTPFGDS